MQKNNPGRLNIFRAAHCEDVHQMFDREDSFSDFTIIVDEKRIRVHKCILALRSPVFRAMFQHDVAETRTNEVTVSEIRLEVMETLLRYLYVRKVTDIDEICWELLVAADKYGVEELKIECEKRACKLVDRENVLRLVQVATLYRANGLKRRCAEFIIAHHAEICASPEFQALYPLVMSDLCAIYAGMLRARNE